MIQILDRFIADKIAAGEVIERPLSIVKELVENSIDAGANRIIVEIRGGGKSYIRVTDNGCGIPSTEVPLAFERHATGKIQTLEDLGHISTLGFRGEALASICAISRVTLFTRPANEAIGTKMEIQGGQNSTPEPAGVNVGTTMLVEDVFYNTPARRKFMRSDAAEASAIIDFVQKMAIFYAGIAFQLINNGKNILTTAGDGDPRNAITRIYPDRGFHNLLEIQGEYTRGFISDPGTTRTNRSGQIFFVNGRYVQSDVIEKGLMDGYDDRIFSGHPIAVLFITVPPESIDVNIHPNKKEIKFLDAASVKRDIANAVKSVFFTEASIPETRASGSNEPSNDMSSRMRSSASVQSFDSSFIIEEQIENNGSRSDSSASSEISDGETLISGREASGRPAAEKETGLQTEQLGIRDFLRNKEHAVSAERSETRSCDDQSKTAGIHAAVSVLHTTNTEVLYDERKKREEGFLLGETEVKFANTADFSPKMVDEIDLRITTEAENRLSEAEGPSPSRSEKIPKNPPLTSQEILSLAPPTMRLFDFEDLTVCGYVFSAYIITRAEDNLFVLDQHAAHERILYEKLVRQYNSSEHLPQPMLTPILLNTSSDVYCGERNWMEILERVGYDIEDFGMNTFIIRGIPAYMDLTEAETFARETMQIQEDEIHLHRNTPVVDKLIMRSCKAAVKANDSLSEEEIRQLLDSLSRCINPFSCPHGRPTFIRISKYEIERAFRRK